MILADLTELERETIGELAAELGIEPDELLARVELAEHVMRMTGASSVAEAKRALEHRARQAAEARRIRREIRVLRVREHVAAMRDARVRLPPTRTAARPPARPRLPRRAHRPLAARLLALDDDDPPPPVLCARFRRGAS